MPRRPDRFASADPAMQPTHVSNCFCWSRSQLRRHGGAVAIVRSRWWWGWHMLWSADGQRWYAFTPLTPRRQRPWWRPPLWFKGRPALVYHGAGEAGAIIRIIGERQ
jgi:hypothetical protein